MTKNDVIRMAKEAGLFTHKEVQPELLAFANLVASAERGACETAMEDIARKYQKAHEASSENIADECAAAIRARRTT